MKVRDKKCYTEDDFKVFKKECRHWQKEFGLVGWDLYFEHRQLPVKEDGQIAPIGQCFIVAEHRVATVRLTKKFPEDTEYAPELNCPKVQAKHEMLHVLFGRYSCYASSRHALSRDLDEEEENIVRILQKVIGSNYENKP